MRLLSKKSFAFSLPEYSIADTIPNYRSTEDRWGKAMQTLSDDEKRNIDFDGQDELSVLRSLLEAVENHKMICIQRRWKYTQGNGEVVVLRDLLEKIAAWVARFKEIGDMATQYDPGYASRPWTSICFFLQVSRLQL
jgi:hypothetical protein